MSFFNKREIQVYIQGNEFEGELTIDFLKGTIQVVVFYDENKDKISINQMPDYIRISYVNISVYILRCSSIFLSDTIGERMITYNVDIILLVDSVKYKTCAPLVKKASLYTEQNISWYNLSCYKFNKDESITWEQKPTQIVKISDDTSFTIESKKIVPYCESSKAIVKIKQGISINFSYDNPKNYRTVLENYNWFVSYIRLFTHRKPVWNEIDITFDDALNDENNLTGQLILARPLEECEEGTKIHPLYPFSRFEDVVSENWSNMKIWFQMNQKLELPISLYISSTSDANQLLKVSFLLAIQGLECLHRNCYWPGVNVNSAYKEYLQVQAERYPECWKDIFSSHMLIDKQKSKNKKKIQLADRLYDLLTYNGINSPFFSVSRKPDAYELALIIANTRNYYSHYYSKDQAILEGEGLFTGTYICQSLLLYHILLQSGVNAEKVKEAIQIEIGNFDGYNLKY